MRNELSSQDRLIVDTVRLALPGLIAAYRFGSSTTGATHRGSDIDVAVLAVEPLASDARFDLQERLAALLGRDVDLVDLAAATPVMAIQVVAHGCLVFEADGPARGDFEDRALSAYARLNEERRGILERIATEGSVYGR